MLFKDLKENSKVWIYTSDRSLSDSESAYFQSQSNEFVTNWAAHGVGLKAESLVYKNRFLIIVADESQANASGCSIDSSVKFVKAMGVELGTDFFNRMNLMVTKDEEELKPVHISELSNYLDEKVYNPMITTLEQLREEWLIPVSSSTFV